MRLPAQGGICASRTAEGVRYKKVTCNATPKKNGRCMASTYRKKQSLKSVNPIGAPILVRFLRVGFLRLGSIPSGLMPIN